MKKLLTVLAMAFAVASCGDGTKSGDAIGDADIVTFTFTGIAGTATIDKTAHVVTVKAYQAVSLTNIVAEFTLSADATATVDDTAQVSKATTNNFTDPVIYKVSSGDGKTIHNWTVVITVDNSATVDKVIISNIANFPTEPVEGTTIKAVVLDSNNKPVELASAIVENGSGTLQLSGTVKDEHLSLFRDYSPPAVKLSDADLRFAIVYFYVYDSRGEFIGDIYFEHQTASSDLIYADRRCTATGTVQGATYSKIFNLNFAGGFNWTQYVETDKASDSWINGVPLAAEWVYQPFKV